MLEIFRRFLPAQDTDESENRSTIRTLQTIVIFSMIGAIMSFVTGPGFGGTAPARITMASLFFLLLASLIALRRGTLWPAQILAPTSLFTTVTFLVISGNGFHDVTFLAYGGVIIAASLTLGQSAALVFAGLIIITTVAIGTVEIRGLLVSPGSPLTAPDTLIFATILILAITFTQRALINRMNESLKRARQNEQEQKKANQDLLELQRTLENRVEQSTEELATRSQDLENANTGIQRRAAQFEALALVTQAITSVRDLKELLPGIAAVISEKFGFYHVGVFLLDEIKEFAVLSAANSEGGRRMLERNHRLRVGDEGIVGYVTSTGKPCIALDVGKDAIYFGNPDLPDTHSEMALPLKNKNEIIGALDVQSTETGAFSEEDIQMLSLLADQVSLAIENARLFDETRRALAESEVISRQSTREAWGRLRTEQNLLGYRYNITGASPLEKLIELTESGTSKGKSLQRALSQVAVPIELRGETIGTLVVQSPSAGTLNQDQIDLVKAVAERVALSVENARLFDETTRRAERERLVSDITGKIRSVNDPQSMMQTAMEELRKALGASRVEIVPQTVKGSD